MSILFTKLIENTRNLNANAPTYYLSAAGAVTADDTIMWDLFNAPGSGKIMKILKVVFHNHSTAAVTGIAVQMGIHKTTAVGTGGNALSMAKADSTNPDIPAQVTARSLPTGGATSDGIRFGTGVAYTEEGINETQKAVAYEYLARGQPITCREGEGIRGQINFSGTAAGQVVTSIMWTLE